jgi:anti-sigma B factor antagonist
MLSIRIENIEDAAVLRCVGRIVAGDPIRALQDAVMCQVGKRLVLLDLAEVDIIDAAGLGSLIFLKTLACVAGMEFKLMSASERIRELLNVANLDSVFETWLPEDLGIWLKRAAKRSHPRNGTGPDEQYSEEKATTMALRSS